MKQLIQPALLATILLAYSSCTNAQNSHQMKEEQLTAAQAQAPDLHYAYELAVWRAKEAPEKHRDLILNQTNKGLAQLKGFVKRTVYQCIDDPNLLFDWVAWDNMADALQAAKAMPTIPELNTFVGLIENTVVFEHYAIHDYHQKAQGNRGIVELVVYQLNPDAAIHEFKQAYSTGMAQATGYQNRYILENSKGENQWAEFVYWQSAANAKSAAKTMQGNPAIGKVFQNVKEVKLVHHYFKKLD